MLTKLTARTVLSLLTLAVCLPAAAQENHPMAGEYTSADQSLEVAELRAAVEALREQSQIQLTSGYEAVDGCGCGGCGGGCAGGCGGGCGCVCDGCGRADGCTCCRSCGWFFGGEVIWMKPHNNAGTGLAGLGIGLEGIETDHEGAGRGWIGYQSCDGLGIRFKYWGFSQDQLVESAFPGVTSVFHRWDADVYDLELTDSTVLGCGWDVTFSSGIRFVDYEETVGTNPGPAIVSNTFSGIGLTGGLELRRQITCNLGYYASARASVVADDQDTVVGAPPAVTRENTIKSIYEARLGMEYIMPVCGGGYYFIRTGYEVQYWDGFGVSPVGIGSNDPSTGFTGFALAIGLQR